MLHATVYIEHVIHLRYHSQWGHSCSPKMLSIVLVLPLVGQVFVVMIVLMSQNHSILVHLVYIKPGGVPDRLCVFPADES